MNKIIASIAVATVLISIAACQQDQPEIQNGTPPEQTTEHQIQELTGAPNNVPSTEEPAATDPTGTPYHVPHEETEPVLPDKNRTPYPTETAPAMEDFQISHHVYIPTYWDSRVPKPTADHYQTLIDNLPNSFEKECINKLIKADELALLATSQIPSQRATDIVQCLTEESLFLLYAVPLLAEAMPISDLTLNCLRFGLREIDFEKETKQRPNEEYAQYYTRHHMIKLGAKIITVYCLTDEEIERSTYITPEDQIIAQCITASIGGDYVQVLPTLTEGRIRQIPALSNAIKVCPEWAKQQTTE